MLRVFGPDTPLQPPDWKATPLEVDASLLCDALSAYGNAFDVSFTPYDGSWPSLPFDKNDPKWFIYRSKRPKWEEVAVDIHIKRDGGSICPRQNLNFPLQSGDEVHIGPLAC